MSITSRKAEYVSQHAPHCCQMWFICKGKLINTREGSFDLGNASEFYCSAHKSSKGRRVRDDYETDSHKDHSGRTQENEEAPKKARKEHDETKSKGSEADSSPCAPQDFLCPISMDIMRDPHVAADGFTYEAKEIRTWLSGGNHKSPITGARLASHHLTPNYTLRSVIKDWLQQHPNYKQ